MAPERETSRRRVWLRQQFAHHALGRLAVVFDRVSIRWMPVKGVILAPYLYEDPTDRDYLDVDVLVPRSDFQSVERLIEQRGWPISYRSREMGELVFHIDGVPVEIHSEVGRRDLTGLNVDQFVEPSTVATATFGKFRRIDDVDHAILVAANVVKDWFVLDRPHHLEDLGRLLIRLQGRELDIVDRAGSGGFLTGLYNVASTMVNACADRRALPLLRAIGRPKRTLQPRLASFTRRHPHHLANLAVASITNDHLLLRLRSVERIVRRGLYRLLVSKVSEKPRGG